LERIIDFLRYRYILIGLSIFLFMIFSAGTFLNNGFNWGIDFVGGVKITARFEQGIDSNQIRSIFTQNNINASVQKIGKDENNEYIIGTKLLAEGEASERSYEIIKGILEKGFNNVEILGNETVGPAIGDYLRNSAITSLLIVIVLMLIYLSFRFEVKYSVGAIVALFHDIILSTAFCGMMKVEMNIPVVAALLTIFGYSVNDTIIIFDRIRENVNIKSKQTFFEVINKSISQTLTRTLLTSLLTLFAVLAIFVIASDALTSFSFVLIFGIIVGTYSSIYIASPIVLFWEKIRTK
jgi:preprotein translocase subunit SecF